MELREPGWSGWVRDAPSYLHHRGLGLHHAPVQVNYKSAFAQGWVRVQGQLVLHLLVFLIVCLLYHWLLLLIYLFLAVLCGLWDLSSRDPGLGDRTHTLGGGKSKVLSTNHWTIREFPLLLFLHLLWVYFPLLFLVSYGKTSGHWF